MTPLTQSSELPTKGPASSAVDVLVVAGGAELVAAIEAVAPEAAGQLTFAPDALPFPQEYDAAPLSGVIGRMPHTPLAIAVAETVGRFRQLAHGPVALEP